MKDFLECFGKGDGWEKADMSYFIIDCSLSTANYLWRSNVVVFFYSFKKSTYIAIIIYTNVYAYVYTFMMAEKGILIEETQISLGSFQQHPKINLSAWCFLRALLEML